VTLAIFVLILASACGFAAPDATPIPVPRETPLPPGAKVLRLDIQQVGAREHQTVEIEVRTTVIWTNRDKTILHNVTHFPLERGVEPAFESDNLAFGEVFQHTFNEVGEYIYICRVHAVTSKAIITVVNKSPE
jgi:plastocyanin